MPIQKHPLGKVGHEMDEKGKVSEAQRRATEKYLQKLEEIKVRVPKGSKEAIKTHAEAHGQSVNGFINEAIDEKMERDKAAQEAKEEAEE